METQMLVDWLRGIADDVERRGIEESSVSCMASIGTAEVKDGMGDVHCYNKTKDFFLAAHWRYASDG